MARQKAKKSAFSQEDAPLRVLLTEVPAAEALNLANCDGMVAQMSQSAPDLDHVTWHGMARA
jgi:hypothetical protein